MLFFLRETSEQGTKPRDYWVNQERHAIISENVALIVENVGRVVPFNTATHKQ